MPEPSDVDLLGRWQAGDLRAGDELAARYFLALRAYFLTKVPSDYEDLVSQRRDFESRTRHDTWAPRPGFFPAYRA